MSLTDHYLSQSSQIWDLKLVKLESRISQLKVECKPAFETENIICENLEMLVKWIEMAENLLLSVERADSIEMFNDAYLCFSVSFIYLFEN